MTTLQGKPRPTYSAPKKREHIRYAEVIKISEAVVNSNLPAGSAPRSTLLRAEPLATASRAPRYSFSGDVCIQRIFLRLLVQMFDVSYFDLSEELGVSIKKIARWVKSEGNDSDNLDVPFETFDDCVRSLLNTGMRAKYYDCLGLEMSKMTKTPYKDFALFSTGDPDEEALNFPDRINFYDELIATLHRIDKK